MVLRFKVLDDDKVIMDNKNFNKKNAKLDIADLDLKYDLHIFKMKKR